MGGLEWKVHYLAKEFAASGHKVTVFTPHPHRAYRSVAAPPAKGYVVIRRGYPGPGMGRFGVITWLLRRAVRQVHRVNPIDVIHCHPLGIPSQIGVSAALGSGTVVVATTSGGDVAWQTDEGVVERLPPKLHRWVRASAARLDAIVAVSRSMRSAINALDVHTRIVDIPNGVAWSEFQGGRSRFLRDKLGIAEGTLIVLSVGRNIGSKNYRRAMEAFRLAIQTTPDACYVIVGRDVTHLSATSEARALGPHVRLVDQQPMELLPSIYHSADVFLNASLTEGFSQVNAQALASGLPLVLTDAPGNVDAGDHGGALIASATDVNDMSQKLIELLTNRTRREELALAAHAAGRHYAWEKIAGSYLALFEELLSAQRGGRVSDS